MGDSLHSASPVGGMPSYGPPNSSAGRASAKLDEVQNEPLRDAVFLRSGRAFGLRLLRERVLARSRRRLGIPEQATARTFAEVIDAELAEAFLGRLLSAQNQLAALAAAAAPMQQVRIHLDQALREGVEETLDLLTRERCRDTDALAVVAEVLTAFGNRFASP